MVGVPKLAPLFGAAKCYQPSRFIFFWMCAGRVFLDEEVAGSLPDMISFVTAEKNERIKNKKAPDMISFFV